MDIAVELLLTPLAFQLLKSIFVSASLLLVFSENFTVVRLSIPLLPSVGVLLCSVALPLGDTSLRLSIDNSPKIEHSIKPSVHTPQGMDPANGHDRTRNVRLSTRPRIVPDRQALVR